MLLASSADDRALPPAHPRQEQARRKMWAGSTVRVRATRRCCHSPSLRVSDVAQAAVLGQRAGTRDDVFTPMRYAPPEQSSWMHTATGLPSQSEAPNSSA
jgi:hypothetical protein